MDAFATRLGLWAWGVGKLKSQSGSVLTARCGIALRPTTLEQSKLRQTAGTSLRLGASTAELKETFVKSTAQTEVSATSALALAAASMDTLGATVVSLTHRRSTSTGTRSLIMFLTLNKTTNDCNLRC